MLLRRCALSISGFRQNPLNRRLSLLNCNDVDVIQNPLSFVTSIYPMIPTMKRFATFLIILCATTTLFAQTAVGTWITVDDETGKERSHIEIYEKSGKMYGKIAKSLDENPETYCTTCSGDRANAPYIGMEIITAAEPDGDKEWVGKVYNPEDDSTYKLVMWLAEDPNLLYIRGKHWTGLYRTQTWKRKR